MVTTIPTIPLSPITKSWLLCQTDLEQANVALSRAKTQTHPNVSVSILRKLLEQVKVERHRHDNLTRQMQSVQAATALYWTPDTLAKQIAIIDCQLFSMVKLETSLLCQLDLVNSQLDRLLDFHHYLSHSFAHQLIFWSSLSKTTTSTVIPPVQPKDNLISHLVQVAHRLLHIYRDFSGFAAIMKALMLPQVQRLRSLWKNCPSRIKELFSEMVPILSSDQQYQAYHNILYQKLSYFFFTPSSTLDSKSISKMVVIPWMQPHLLSLRSIVTDYAAIGDDHATLQQTSTTPSKNHLCHQTTSNIELVLSAPGLQKLAVIMALLEQCQTCPSSSDSSFSSMTTNTIPSASSIDILEDYMRPWRQDNHHYNTFSPVSMETTGVNTNNNNNNNNKNNKNNNNSSSSRRSSRHSMHPTTNKSNTSTTVHDLHTLSPGDLLVHHWLVSRVYLRRDQLVDESIQVQPLLPGEQLVCDAFASDDGALEILLRKKLDTTSRQHLTDNKHHTQSTNPASPRISAAFVGWNTSTTRIENGIHNSTTVDTNDEKPQQDGKMDDDDDNLDSHNIKTDHHSNQHTPSYDKGATSLEHINVSQLPSLSLSTDDDHVMKQQQQVGEKTSRMDSANSATALDTHCPEDMITTDSLQVDNGNDSSGMTQDLTVDLGDKSTTTTTGTTATTATTITTTTTGSIASSVSVVIENPSSKQEKEKKDQKAMPTSTNNPSKKSKLSPTAPEFVPLMVVAQSQYENVPSSVAVSPSSSAHGSLQENLLSNNMHANINSNKRNGYIPMPNNINESSSEEEWNGYPTPVLEEEEDIYDQKQQQRRRSHLDNDDDDDDDDEIWTGYPGPQQRHGSMHSIVSDEWKGYEATKEEATWELETALKMKQRDWQGYTLETLNEQELDGQ